MKHSTLLWAMILGLLFGSMCTRTALARSIKIPSLESAKAAAGDLWVVTQETDFGDSYKISISKDAIKFATGNFVIIAKEPDWQVSLLNQKAKVFWTEPLDEFRGVAKIATYNVKKLSPVPSETSEPKIAGQPTAISEGDCQFSEVAIMAMGFKPSKVRLWTATKVPISAGALRVLGKIVGIEGLEGIPLQIKVPLTKHTEEIYCLQTNSCVLSHELDKQTFDIPKEFQKDQSFKNVETQDTPKKN